MSTNPAFGTEEQVSGGGATSLASVRRHVFVCSEVCDGGALRLGPEFQNSSRSGIRSRLFFRERGRGRSGSFGFLQWQAFSSKREQASYKSAQQKVRFFIKVYDASNQ